MNRLEYALNSVAWTLVGIVITLTYQRLNNWWASRQGGGKFPPISAGAYFGSLLVLFGVITSLFQLSAKLESDRQTACQRQINQGNVSYSNERDRRQAELNTAMYNLVIQERQALEKGNDSDSRSKLFINAANNYIDTYADQQKFNTNNRIVPQSVCDNGNPPSIPSNTPSPSPSK